MRGEADLCFGPLFSGARADGVGVRRECSVQDNGALSLQCKAYITAVKLNPIEPHMNFT